jgi:hypothetical protein
MWELKKRMLLVNNCLEYLLLPLYPHFFLINFLTLAKAGLLACFKNSNIKLKKNERKVNQAEYTIITNMLFVLWNV